MPAAAVIPAPIAYIKVVAVKKLVVVFRGFLPSCPPQGAHWDWRPLFTSNGLRLVTPGGIQEIGYFTLNK